MSVQDMHSTQSVRSMRPCLVLTRVEVRRTPGVVTPFVLGDLCAGINLVYGPNASGKTTTAQTIQSILWPGAPRWPHGSYRGHYQLDGAAWVVDFDAGALRCQRDGQDDPPAETLDPTVRDRYVLTLPQLLAADDPTFAATILRESAGGYDLPAAVADLGYRDRVSRPAKEISEVRRARTAVREARRAQDALVRQQDDLADLRVQWEAAAAASVRAGRLKAALDVCRAERRLREATEALERFPAALARCAGDEPDRLAALRSELRAASARLEQAERARDGARVALDGSGLAGMTIVPGLATALRSRAQALQDLAGKVAADERALREAETRRDDARRRITASLTVEQVRTLDADGLGELATLARSLADARGEQAAADEVAAWIGAIEEPADTDRLRDAIKWLELWLRSPEVSERAATARATQLVAVAAVLAIVEALALALLVQWLFAALALAGLALLFLSRRRDAGAGPGRADLAAAEYGRLGLDAPARWRVEEVEQLVITLSERLQRALVDQEKTQRWADLARRRAVLAEQGKRLASEVERTRQRYGAVPEDFATLSVLAANLQSWQSADTLVHQASASLDLERIRHRALLEDLNGTLAPYGYAPAADHAGLPALVDDLDRRTQAASGARETIEGAERALRDELRPEIERRAAAVRGFFKALGLEDGDDNGLRALLGEFDAYRLARGEAGEAESRHRLATEQLSDAGELAGLSDTELAAQLQSAESAAGRLDATHAEIIRIETLVDDAKRKRDLESALVGEGDALDALREARGEEVRLAAGWVLGEAVRERTRDRQRPRVFHHARELFALITQGRYRLEVEDGQPPRFRATDTTTNLTLGLDELSGATRVQLLIAVRVAFVEEMERGPRLPLILDEALGNSDEQRARAIIEAAIAIARAGRQVFYFTAQHDEVGKWLGVLQEQAEVPHVAINLSDVRGLADFDRLPPLSVLASPFPTIPRPDGLGYDDYGRLLHVPGLDPRTDAGGVHLWYLEREPERLHALLSRGITTWGQFRTLAELDGGRLLPDNAAGDLIAARARLFGAAFEAWRIGRPPRVDRSVIIASGAITPNFLERVVDLCDAVGGSGSALVAALQDNRVPRLQRPRVEQLQAYLTEGGYLEVAEPLGPDDLRVHVLAAVAEDFVAGRLSVEEVDLAISRLPGVAGPATSAALPELG